MQSIRCRSNRLSLRHSSHTAIISYCHWRGALALQVVGTGQVLCHLTFQDKSKREAFGFVGDKEPALSQPLEVPTLPSNDNKK